MNIVRAYRETVPDFPDMLAPKLVRVYPDETPDSEDQDPKHVEAEHLLCRQPGAEK